MFVDCPAVMFFVQFLDDFSCCEDFKVISEKWVLREGNMLSRMLKILIHHTPTWDLVGQKVCEKFQGQEYKVVIIIPCAKKAQGFDSCHLRL